MSNLTSPKYPEITMYVDLQGPDGNAFAILGCLRREFRRHEISQEEWDTFYEIATSGDYTNLLETCSGWVTFVTV